jgi:hypothetical protein
MHIRRASDAHPMRIRRTSRAHPVGIRWTSGGHRVCRWSRSTQLIDSERFVGRSAVDASCADR